jgi:hypothetical protein
MECSDRGPVDRWVERAQVRDQFYLAWWDRDRQCGS